MFPFFTAKEWEEGGAGHWETGVWETFDIEVWDTTGDLDFPLRFSRQVLEKEAPEEEPNECIRTLRELVIQWHNEEDTMDPTFPEEEMTTGDQNLATQIGWYPM